LPRDYFVSAPSIAGGMTVASNIIQLLMHAASRRTPGYTLTCQVRTKTSPQGGDCSGQIGHEGGKFPGLRRAQVLKTGAKPGPQGPNVGSQIAHEGGQLSTLMPM